jgi:hypothetical protein
MTTRSATAAAIAALLAGCGTDSTGELVVENAGQATLLGASSAGVYWTAPGSGGARVLGSSLAALPAEPQELAPATGAAEHATDPVILANAGALLRAQLDPPHARAALAPADAIGEIPGDTPRLVWTVADKLSWGMSDAERTLALVRTTRVDHVRTTPRRIYAAVDSTASERRVVYVDLAEALIHNLTSSSAYASEFPGAADGATYQGRIVGADADGAYWLVEESPSRRAVLVALPARGEPTVVLDTIRGATGFFVTPDAFYWQEGDVLLTAPRTGGSATIAAELDGAAGAIADGFVYYVTPGGSIERLAL